MAMIRPALLVVLAWIAFSAFSAGRAALADPAVGPLAATQVSQERRADLPQPILVAVADAQSVASATEAATPVKSNRLLTIVLTLLGACAALVIVIAALAQGFILFAIFAYGATRLLTRLAILPPRERRKGWLRIFNAADDPDAVRPSSKMTKAERAARRKKGWWFGLAVELGSSSGGGGSSSSGSSSMSGGGGSSGGGGASGDF
jgi:uncharacterized membrane protein YgcG